MCHLGVETYSDPPT